MRKIDYRIPVPAQDARRENLCGQYAADAAAWVWHPELIQQRESVVEFELLFEQQTFQESLFFISADNRFELFLDDEFIGMGPDRCDLAHWSFSSLRIPLTAGTHSFRVRCWYFAYESETSPLAQIGHSPGFLFGADDPGLRNRFNTGIAAWMVREIPGVSLHKTDRAIGSSHYFDVSAVCRKTESFSPVVTVPPRQDNFFGSRKEGRRLYPSMLPEQMREPYTGKIRVRCVLDTFEEEDDLLIPFENTSPDWQNFFDGTSSVTVPAGKKIVVVADLEHYLCSNIELSARGGAEGVVEVCHAESFYENCSTHDKPERDRISKKYFVRKKCCQRDVFHHFDRESRKVCTLWWRAGRYVLLFITAGNEPLTLEHLRFFENRYPAENLSRIVFDREKLNRSIPVMQRTLFACMHETYMDCPFFEQLMYVGDSRLEALTTFCVMPDSRLARRALHLFDWSRSCWDGLVSERYPSSNPQLSCTFSCLWPLMVEDYLMYRHLDDEEFLHLRRSVRSMHMAMAEYVSKRNLLENLPGWSFVDWVEQWNNGVPYPRKNEGCSSLFSLHYLLSLASASHLEEYLPENDGIKLFYEKMYEKVAHSVLQHFLDPESGLLADDLEKKHFSIHAQCLAFLSGLRSARESENIFNKIFDMPGVAGPTLYFIHYLFECLYRLDQGAKILEHVFLWENMLDRGALTTWESPEPTRSDCHAWGAHLYYHYFSSFVGIRPAAWGFEKVNVFPSPGAFRQVSGAMPHPQGEILFDLEQKNGSLTGWISLPGNVSGTLGFNGKNMPLLPGKNLIDPRI